MARHYRKVIRITAEDSPNVQVYLRLKAECEARGLPPPDPISCPMVTPGVLSAGEYVKRLATFDEAKISVSLHARFWEGRETLLFPPTWMDRAEMIWRQLGLNNRRGEAMGIDTGEGAAESVWVIGDKRGMLAMDAIKTPDTNFIHGHTIMLINKWGVPAQRVCFDRGGGGKQAADRLRACGFNVRTVAFGESVRLEPKRARVLLPEKKEVREETYAYKNRRAQMYHLTSQLMDPVGNDLGWGMLPDEELRRQLSIMPKITDDEGRYYLPPKNRRDDKDTRNTLSEMLGCSPDRADALVLMVFGMMQRALIPMAGVT